MKIVYFLKLLTAETVKLELVWVVTGFAPKLLFLLKSNEGVLLLG